MKPIDAIEGEFIDIKLAEMLDIKEGAELPVEKGELRSGEKMIGLKLNSSAGVYSF